MKKADVNALFDLLVKKNKEAENLGRECFFGVPDARVIVVDKSQGQCVVSLMGYHTTYKIADLVNVIMGEFIHIVNIEVLRDITLTLDKKGELLQQWT